MHLHEDRPCISKPIHQPHIAGEACSRDTGQQSSRAANTEVEMCAPQLRTGQGSSLQQQQQYQQSPEAASQHQPWLMYAGNCSDQPHAQAMLSSLDAADGRIQRHSQPRWGQVSGKAACTPQPQCMGSLQSTCKLCACKDGTATVNRELRRG